MKPGYETTGEVCGDKNDEFCRKAECLSHFSFEKSDKKLMIVDIQGSGANLYDPEIATGAVGRWKNTILCRELIKNSYRCFFIAACL